MISLVFNIIIIHLLTIHRPRLFSPPFLGINEKIAHCKEKIEQQTHGNEVNPITTTIEGKKSLPINPYLCTNQPHSSPYLVVAYYLTYLHTYLLDFCCVKCKISAFLTSHSWIILPPFFNIQKGVKSNTLLNPLSPSLCLIYIIGIPKLRKKEDPPSELAPMNTLVGHSIHGMGCIFSSDS